MAGALNRRSAGGEFHRPAGETVVQVAWCLVVAASGLGGYALATREFVDPWQGLSQQASLLTGGAYVVLAVVALLRPRVRLGLVRGALATLLVLVSTSYLLLLDADLSQGWSRLEHLVTPALVVVDYVLVCRGPFRWWHPPLWLLPPLGYLAYYVAADVDLYSFLDPTSPDFGPTVVGFLVATLAIGYGLLGVSWGASEAGAAPG